MFYRSMKENCMKIWTIAYVNYKTSVYMYWQLKGLYQFNNPQDFEVIIVDNSNPWEQKRLESICTPYQKKYNNIRIIYFRPQSESASGQHGEGLTEALRHATGKYFLSQDPDYFFVKKDYLNFLKKYLESGLVAIGSGYPNKVGLGNPRFPCAYGCAHPTALIRNLDFNAETSQEKWDESMTQFPEYEYSFDVGYKIRRELSSPKDNTSFITFEQKRNDSLANAIGMHSFEILTHCYSLNGEIISFHLFRGSFTGSVSHAKDPNRQTPKQWLQVRNKLGKYFYTFLATGKSPQDIKLLYTRLKQFLWHKQRMGRKRIITCLGITIRYEYKK